MKSYSATEIILTLKKKDISLFTLTEFSRIFSISNKNTLFKKVQQLEKKRIIRRLVNGKYALTISHVNDFRIAQFILSPSYISLESALSFYGITTGFSYMTTSITTKTTKTHIINDKEFSYSHISSRHFWGYEKKEDFLIANKEKAILDYSYFVLKGLKTPLDVKELDISEIDKSVLMEYARRWGEPRLLEIINKI